MPDETSVVHTVRVRVEGDHFVAIEDSRTLVVGREHLDAPFDLVGMATRTPFPRLPVAALDLEPDLPGIPAEDVFGPLLSEAEAGKRHYVVHNNRGRCLLVPERTILELFLNREDRAPGYVYLPEWPADLPNGLRVESVHHDPLTRSFVFIVTHPSFDPVPDGCRYPDLVPIGEFRMRAVKIANPESV